MHKLNTSKVAMTVGVVLSGWHLLWSALVFLGVAQPIMDFILWAHMINMQYVVGPFDLTACATLVVLTFVVGYVFGYAGALVWNKFHK
jgi:hypothetical protein